MRKIILSIAYLLGVYAVGYGQSGKGSQKASEQDYADLFNAVENGHVSIVEDIINRGVDVNRMWNGGYALNVQGDVDRDISREIYNILIRAGANVNARNDNGNALLNRAARDNDTVLVRLLLEKGADPDLLGYTDETSLHSLSDHNPWYYTDEPSPDILKINRDIVSMMKLLIEYGADVNYTNTKGETPLLLNMKTLNIRNYHNSTIRLLTTYGASSIIADHDGMTSLDMLDRVLYDTLTQKLINRQAESGINRALQRKMEPLFNMYRGKIGIGVVRNLVIHGVDAYLHDDITLSDNSATRLYSRSTPLIVAATLGFDHLITGIVANGANVHCVDDKWNTSLIRSIEGRHHKSAELLLYFGARTDSRNRAGLTPLRIACCQRDYEMLELLCRFNADLSMDSNNPITDAVLMSDVRLVKFFIDKNVNVDAYDAKGRTPLMLATQNRDMEMVKLLIDSGADFMITDDADNSVWDYAGSDETLLLMLPDKNR